MPDVPFHVLSRLELPTRYEQLSNRLGPDVAKLLTAPEESLENVKRLATLAVQTREGMLVPCFGKTGTGKTTLASNLSFFAPALFGPTVVYDGMITAEALMASLENHTRDTPVANGKVVPFSLDHREGAPPTDAELAAIKRFLRTAPTPCLVLWLETDRERAVSIASRYTAITGRTIVELPLLIEGPSRKAWPTIAETTIELCNPISNKQARELGVEVEAYAADQFPSLGEYLRQIAIDLANMALKELASTKRPVTLILVFVSEALNRGALPSFTIGAEPGLLDSHSLLRSTPESAIGKRWEAKRGVLTHTVLRLDARAFWMPPAAAVAALHRYGPTEVKAILDGLDRKTPSPTDVSNYLERTDLGRYLLGDTATAYETRGRPAEDAKEAIAALARDYGYGHGNDKILNRALLDALVKFCATKSIAISEAAAETSLAFAKKVIPDNQLDLGSRVICIEYIWRSGDVLESGRRSEAAQYALEKLHNYAVALGWTAP